MAMADSAAEFEDDAEVVAQQEEVQQETDSLLSKITVAAFSTVLCLVLLIGYLGGGFGGVLFAGFFFLVAVVLGLGVGIDFGG